LDWFPVLVLPVLPQTQITYPCLLPPAGAALHIGMPTTIGTFYLIGSWSRLLILFYGAMSLRKDYTFTWVYNTLRLEVVSIPSGQK
jgi:hypothetical protein